MKLSIQDTFNKELPSDPIIENYIRQVTQSCFSFTLPTPCKNPSLIHVSDAMLKELGLDDEDAQSALFLSIFSGNKVLEDTHPYAMCYGGHQFGHWAGQLGDGRAINLFEIVHDDNRWALQLKGAGKTPYSRSADGLAVLRSSLREYLCSEAMFHLNVPTTRALSLVLSGNEVLRDVMYDGNPAYEKGAIVCRVAPSFIRFGNFQQLAALNDIENLRKLTNNTIRYFYPHLGEPSKETYEQFLKEVAERTMEMALHWERVGFVHGVMNTDNMSILGLTIDYGPYGWLENYDPNWTPNTTDAQLRRYRFGNQGNIALWNVYQLANALVPLIEETKELESILQSVQEKYINDYHSMMLQKIGLAGNTANSKNLIRDLRVNLEKSEMDMTLFFRTLSNYELTKSEIFIAQLAEFSYSEHFSKHHQNWMHWFKDYDSFLEVQPSDSRKSAMDAINPKYVLRNYMAQLAIDDANKGNYQLLDELYRLLKNPYSEQPEMQKWFSKRPDWAKNKVGSSQLSCSS